MPAYYYMSSFMVDLIYIYGSVLLCALIKLAYFLKFFISIWKYEA